MNLFSLVGNAIRKIIGSDHEVDKMEVASRLEDLSGIAGSISEAFSSKAVTEAIAAATKTAKRDSALEVVGRFYTSELSARARSAEARDGIFTAIGATARIVSADLQAILKNFDTFLGGRQSSGLTPEAMRLSDVAMVGYLGRVGDFLRWASYLLNTGTTVDDPNAAPRYQQEALIANCHTAIKFINATMDRTLTFMAEIDRIRHQGRDVAAVTDGVTFDQYASDRDYSPNLVASTQGFMRSPVVTIGQYRIERERARVQENKHLQNWLRNKITLLKLQQAKTDPESSEYRRVQSYVDNYMRDLTLIDKELDRYAQAV